MLPVHPTSAKRTTIMSGRVYPPTYGTDVKKKRKKKLEHPPYMLGHPEIRRRESLKNIHGKEPLLL
jgi:hypothetical protein